MGGSVLKEVAQSTPPHTPNAPPPGDQPARATAPCGCLGQVLAHHRGLHPYTTLLIQDPCTTGHPHRVAAGVLERFPKVTPA